MHCLNVISSSYRDAILAADLELVGVGARVGEPQMSAGDGLVSPVPLEQTVWCAMATVAADGTFGPGEEITYQLFDGSRAAELRAALVDFWTRGAEMYGGTVPEGAPVSYIEGAEQFVVDEGETVSTTVLGDGWLLSVRSVLAVDEIATAAPDATFGADAVAQQWPPTQMCEFVLPPATERDLMVDFGLQSSETVDSGGDVICSSVENQGWGPALAWAPHDGTEPAGDVVGTTEDGTGSVVGVDGGHDVYFDDAIVQVRFDDEARSAELASLVHAPRWPTLPIA